MSVFLTSAFCRSIAQRACPPSIAQPAFCRSIAQSAVLPWSSPASFLILRKERKKKLLNSVPIVHIEFAFIEAFPGEPFHKSRDYSITFTQSTYHFDISGSIWYFAKIDIRFPELASSFTETKHLDSKSCSL